MALHFSRDEFASRQAKWIEALEMRGLDGHGVNPADQLCDALADRGCSRVRIGVEYNAFGPNAKSSFILNAAIHGFWKLHDASNLVLR